MSCEKDKDTAVKEVVTSVGNAWVICRSKSHSGRVYYFNTFTGKSAWNLSDSEMEKLKNTCQPVNQVTLAQHCPEPQDPPDDNHLPQETTTIVPSKVYNKQIINNQITRPSVSHCSNCVNTGNQMPGYNSNIWTVPSMQPIFIAPTMPAIVDQQQPVMNFVTQSTPGPSNSYNNWQQNLNHPRSYRGTNWKRNFVQRRGGNSYKQQQQFSRQQIHKNFEDLRSVLTAKRKLQDLCNRRHQNLQIKNAMVMVNPNAIIEEIQTVDCNDSKDDLCPSDTDEEWLAEHTKIEGSKPSLDVSALSKLASKDGDLEYWYIVVDYNILLNHFEFLNAIINSDVNCLLVVHESTMTKLRQLFETGATRLKTRARRAIYFVMHQIKSENAVIDEQHENKETENSKQALTMCISLSDQNQHVVLLTNDKNLLQHKNEVAFPIFSVEDMKKFLEVKHVDEEIQFPESIEQMSITIPNNIDDNMNIKQSPTESSPDLNNDPATNIRNSTDSCTPKNTVDAEVQTDFPTSENDTSIKCIETQTQLPSEEIDNPQRDTRNANDKDLTKKREIRLKRVTTQTKQYALRNASSSKPNKVKEMQFKWHRRRNMKSSNTSTVSETSNNILQTDASTEENLNTQTFNMPEINQSNSNICNSDVMDSEASSCIIRPNIDDSVVIDETSTSGIISNSVSNADSESNCSLLQKYASFLHSTATSEHVMFEITSRFMEEHLQRNSDEWISRFLQIMEEVLSQILRQEPPFVDAVLRPPWTAPEAVECIKKKFHDSSEVTDACSKLSEVFFKMGDAKGHIRRDMDPANFMEMYSYGVYLVDALVNLQDCEDLQTATESLAKLLSDIQDTNFDAINQDSFAENMNELSLNVSEMPPRAVTPNCEPCGHVETPPATKNTESQNSTPTTENTRKRYSLRSDRKKLNEETEEQKVTFVRQIDPQSNFFSSLQLQKNDNPTPPHNIVSDKSKVPTENTNENNKTNNIQESPKAVDTGPKIIRNFTKCLEFEERIKNHTRQELDLNELEYCESYEGDVNMNGVVGDDYDFSRDIDYYENDFCANDNILLQNGNDIEQSMSSDISEQDEIKWFIAAVWCEIKLILSQVHTFCMNSIQFLQGSDKLSFTKNIEILDRAEKSKMDLENLSRALQSVDADSQLSGNCLQETLRYFSIDINYDIVLNEEQLKKYREMVRICTSQANDLLTSVNIIINTINK